MKTRILYIPFILLLCTTQYVTACNFNKKEELQNIIQLIISSNELNNYYHVDVLPDRKPLRILNNNVVPETTQLNLFDMEVEYTTKKENFPYLVFENILEKNNSIIVSFRYPPEGIHGMAFIKRANLVWIIEKIIIKEN